ncbi:amidohydrolase [Microbulbifer hainanensis]|uniref:amidohydrolase n=1 Tax=Microbulbifer hainanensis TaxID=2735675 RepID=UPI0018682827|nr:amidohydrolase [Microbulbifer hainanensis]
MKKTITTKISPALLAVLCAVFGLAGCGDQSAADRIYLNGDILTMDKRNPTAEALAVKGEKIVAVGSRAEIAALAGAETETVDLQGKALLPGFVAAHEHPAISAVFYNFVDMSGFSHDSAESAWGALRKAVDSAPAGDWVYAMGLDPVLLPGLQPPTRAQLDRLAPDNPVFIISQSLHNAWVNSSALAAMGIDEQSPDPGEGSYYGRDADGRLNGALVEKPALEPFLETHKNPLHVIPAYSAVLSDLRRAGYTSVASLGFNMPALAARWASLQDLEPRIRQFFYYRGENLRKLDGSPETGSDFFRVQGGKFWYDGSPYSGSMVIEQPYLDSELARQLGIAHGSHGEPVVTQKELVEEISGLQQRGWQTATHVQGDRAARAYIAAMREVRDALPAAEQQAFAARRHRLEHGLLLDRELLPALAELGVTPSFHINHLYYYGEALHGQLLGPARTERILPVRNAFALHMHPTLHADSPMFPAAPFSLMQTAITRRTRGGSVIGADEAITREQALRAMTINGAWQLGMEDRIGSLAPGKLADLVIVDRNPLDVPADQWREIKVERSILAGQPN